MPADGLGPKVVPPSFGKNDAGTGKFNMNGWLITAILLLTVQVPAEPPEYPQGWYCTPKGDVAEGIKTPDHPCACKRMYADEACELNPTHDAACKQFCHENHCGCPVACPEPKG